MRDAYLAAVDAAAPTWRISHRGVSGVPVPAWQLADGTIVRAATLPVDPRVTPPPGMDEAGRGTAFTDTGVLDTWWTSSLTPRILGHDTMTLRHQGRDILGRAVLPAIDHTGTPPWSEVSITGWVSAAGDKMSKSRGWTYRLRDLLDAWSRDAVRYWAATVPSGSDTVVDDTVLTAGQALADTIRTRRPGHQIDPAPVHAALDAHDPAAALRHIEDALEGGADTVAAARLLEPIMPAVCAEVLT